jgi:hypothetical protein
LQNLDDALQGTHVPEISRQPGMPPLEGFSVFDFALMAPEERQRGGFAAFATSHRNADAPGQNF